MKRLIIQYTTAGLRTEIKSSDHECYATLYAIEQALNGGKPTVKVNDILINLRNVVYVDLMDAYNGPEKTIGTRGE